MSAVTKMKDKIRIDLMRRGQVFIISKLIILIIYILENYSGKRESHR